MRHSVIVGDYSRRPADDNSDFAYAIGDGTELGTFPACASHGLIWVGSRFGWVPL